MFDMFIFYLLQNDHIYIYSIYYVGLSKNGKKNIFRQTHIELNNSNTKNGDVLITIKNNKR